MQNNTMDWRKTYGANQRGPQIFRGQVRSGVDQFLPNYDVGDESVMRSTTNVRLTSDDRRCVPLGDITAEDHFGLGINAA